MLTHIHIQHFAIVQSLSLDFQTGLQVLTGETGAGKSIWVDALQIGLGERTDANVIYTNAPHCEITLCFDLKKLPSAQHWLTAHDLLTTEECIIRRIVYRDKPSRTTINGTPMPQQLVRDFSHLLLCVHSQHQHQRLLKSTQQQHLLDQYANNDDLLKTLSIRYEKWKSTTDQLKQLQSQAQSKSANESLWRYQLEEIQTLQLQENEFQESFEKYQQLYAAKNTISGLNEILDLLSGDAGPSATSLLQQAQKKLQKIKSTDESVLQIQSLLDNASIQLDEATATLADHCSDTDFQLSQLDQLEKRLQLIQDIARKHHIEPERLIDIQNTLETQLSTLENIDSEIDRLIKQQLTIEKDYQQIASKLTSAREKAAQKMSGAITDQMQILGMPGGICKVTCQPLTPGVHPHGNESILFTIATNPGQKPQPLGQTVSGGELSRLSLICHVLTAQVKNTPTLIFDEVDVGIGGKTADIVGKLLRQLGEHTQVLCITHLPQVAANGHHHFKAEKISQNQQTNTTIKPLSNEQRTQEIARMLSGTEITEKSLSHANELLTLHLE